MGITITTVLKMVPLIILVVISAALFLGMIEFNMDLFCLQLILVILLILIIFKPGKGGLSSTDSKTGADPQTSGRNL